MVSANTDLGGGRNGHLGLGLTAAKYVSISQTENIRSVHPGQASQVGTTQHETIRLLDDYKREIRLF